VAWLPTPCVLVGNGGQTRAARGTLSVHTAALLQMAAIDVHMRISPARRWGDRIASAQADAQPQAGGQRA
jgi:hypothetical protein